MKAYLTVCHGGRGLVTFLPPVIARIRGTHHEDAFEQVGEPIAIRYLCHEGMKSLFGELPTPLQPRRVEIAARYIE